MKRSLVLLLSALATACASYDGYTLKPGVSMESEVRGLMGEPAAEYATGGGSRRLAYPRGPLGSQTFMADLGPDGRVTGVQQVLKDETFYQIRAGMTRDEVLRLIGPPVDTMVFARLRETSWEWRYVDTWGYRAIFSVNFNESGIAVSKFTRRLDRDKGVF